MEFGALPSFFQQQFIPGDLFLLKAIDDGRGFFHRHGVYCTYELQELVAAGSHAQVYKRQSIKSIVEQSGQLHQFFFLIGHAFRLETFCQLFDQYLDDPFM